MKVVLVLALLALASCKDIKLDIKTGTCKVDAATHGAILMKGKNQVIITLEDKITTCATFKAEVAVEKRMMAIGVKVDEYYTDDKFTKDVKWTQQI